MVENGLEFDEVSRDDCETKREQLLGLEGVKTLGDFAKSTFYR